MKLRKNWKRFWTLDRHHGGGFTLVELIVVIAILAILGGVAIPAYSGYVKKANMQADMTLASEIEQALVLAHYAGTIEPGASVVVYYGDSDVTADGEGTDAAMIAAFGEGYAESLRLKHDGWELGVVGDAAMMGYVNDSTYNTEGGLDTMLGQVQTVVNIAGNYFDGININEDIAAYAEKAGITLGENNKVLDGDGNAVANATVFYVANNIAGATNTDDYESAWMEACFGDVTALTTIYGGDVFSAYSAGYAAVLGMATYIDSQLEEPKYVDMLTLDTSIDGQAALATRLSDVASAMDEEQNAFVEEYLNLNESGEQLEGSKMFTDAMAFQTYMKGVENSSDSMLENNDIYSDNYFNDGTMLNYVQNYIDAGSILADLSVSENAFVFIYDGTGISCVPMDY